MMLSKKNSNDTIYFLKQFSFLANPNESCESKALDNLSTQNNLCLQNYIRILEKKYDTKFLFLFLNTFCFQILHSRYKLIT